MREADRVGAHPGASYYSNVELVSLALEACI